ncbi:polysaccharide biosynthesis/export family protein [Telmatospirillum sp.]|uniref:polysaccharide biosynthesis/export family protein n=1 Tax=Telmatospirillum sp. TaxID=2079197 RepID=UPI00283EE060|nr:polysaccharide biosynthesis/export family protein [Telmatospirillum sp.]MDR3435449.1 polysaccharide export protein [Telmatospirillum sp.]
MDRRLFLLSTLSIAGLAGCTALPDSGPAARDVMSQASATLKETAANAFKYVVVDITQRILDVLGDPGPGSLYKSFGTGHGVPQETIVGIGDTLQIAVFESAAGGLFIPNDAGSRPGNFVTLPTQSVDGKGYITVPYAGLVLAKGRTLPEISREIERKLAGRAIEPQVVLTMTAQISNQATVIGRVGASNKININNGDRVLDILSRAGGIADAGYETFVTLKRGDRKATVYFLNLVQNEQENVFVQPADTLYVYQQRRNFTAFGATGQSGQFPFGQEHLLLTEAVGKAGGLLDNRADPGQILLYRIEPREVLEKMNVDLSAFDRDIKQIPTIYHSNFRDPSSFFVAQRFRVIDADVLYVTNADQVEITKFFNLANTVTGGVASSLTDVDTTRKLIQNLGK